MRLSPRLVDPDLDFPYLLLLVSGGHCQLLEVRGRRRLSPPRDDHRRCRRRGVRQGRQAARPGLSRRPGDRGAGERRRSAGGAAAAAAWSAPTSRISPSPASRARCSARSRAASISPKISPPASSRRWSIASSTAPGARSNVADAPSLVVAGGVAANAAVRSALRQLADGQRPRASRCRRAGCAPTMRR